MSAATATATAKPPAFKHQIEAVRRAVRGIAAGGGYMLAMGVGTGKTRAAIGVARNLDPKPTRILVLAPVVALGVWEREIAKWSGGTPRAPWVLRLRDAAWGRLLGRQPDEPTYALTNYEQLVGPVGEKRLKLLLKWRPDLVILDESQWVKNPTSARTRAVRKLCRGRRVLALSGTPAHTPLDWWAQYALVAPGNPTWSGKFTDYRARVAVMGGPDLAWVVGFRPDEVARTVRDGIEPHTYIVPTSVLDLPEPIESVIPITLGEQEMQVYRRMEKDFLAEVGDGIVIEARNALSKLGKLQQIAGGFLLDDDHVVRQVGDSRLRAALALLDERRHLKVVVACRFRHDIASLATAIVAARPRRDDGTEVDDPQTPLLRVIDGETTPEERTAIEDLFQTTQRPMILLLQARAGGVAITLSKANCLLVYSQETSVIVDQQLRGRVWRPGQTGHVQVATLVAEGTLDEEMYTAVRRGHAGVDLVRHVAAARRPS